MPKAKRIFFVADIKEFTSKLLKNEDRRLIKGLIRAGHDVQVFNYRDAFLQGGLLMSMRFARRCCKTAVADKYKQGYKLDLDYIAKNRPSAMQSGPMFFKLIHNEVLSSAIDQGKETEIHCS